ncbi:MAG: hypothetical protein AMS25_06685 [Gemmatimonas sp. SM23_52]|nr:MAG: hypothetical protein AMS25_06685 [Gemmatimonas sp. SM23_52]
MGSPNRVAAWVPARLRDTGGFALAMAVFALVLLAAVVAGGYFSASQEYQIGRSMKSLTASFYAGEAGIFDVLDGWDPAVYNWIAPAETVTFGPVTFEGGGSYIGKVVRVGSAADSAKRYFYIEAVGRPPGPNLGERRQAAVARARFPTFCCDAAVKVHGDVTLLPANDPKVIGSNDDPPGAWSSAACALYPEDSLPGVRYGSSTDIDEVDGIAGWPSAVVLDPSITRQNIFNFGELNYDSLIAYADLTFDVGVGNTMSFSGSRPSVTADGKCNRDDPDNWGAPENPSHPCFNYFPIIHVTGNLRLVGAGSAQGILLVGGSVDNDSDARFSGPFDFYGIILTKDDLEMDGPGNLYGAAFVAEDVELSNVKPRIQYSRCAVMRAQRLSSLTRPRLLSQRAWVGLF